MLAGMDLSSPCTAQLGAQRGLLTRQQLLDGGVSRAEIRSRLGRGSWRQLLPGVVQLDPALPTEKQRLLAALLFAGPGSWLAGSTAAALHGIEACRVSNPIHVQVPVPRRSRSSGWVSVRNTTLVDERLIERGPLTLACVPRSIVDAAAMAPTYDHTAAIMIEAVQRRIARLDDLKHWIHIRGTQNGRRLRRALDEAASGAWSKPESDLQRLLATSVVIPTLMSNPELYDSEGRRLTTPDVWLDDVGMAVMVHSRQFHAGDLDWENTVESDSDLAACRVVVVGVTPTSLQRNPVRVLARIERAYLTARASGLRAPVTATARPGLWAPLSVRAQA